MRRSELLIALVISFLAVLGTPGKVTGDDATICGRLAEVAPPLEYNGRYVYSIPEPR
jgi:hypothetical protein